MKAKLVSIILLVLLASCDSGGGDSDNDSNDSRDLSATKQVFETQCGTVNNAILVNPVSASTQVNVVRVVSSNLVVVSLVGAVSGDFLVKLHGLTDSGSARAKSTLEALSAGTVYYVSADETCILSVPGGGLAYTGQLFTATGKSFSEAVIEGGYSGDAETSGTCHEELMTTCYSALIEQHAIKSAGEITDFLWKPRAESSYNQGSPVIHANPCDATVYVNGQALMDFGEGNGRCNTSRMFSSCGSYGSNVKVEIFDNKSGLPYFNGNDPFVIVPNGCSRYEFKK